MMATQPQDWFMQNQPAAAAMTGEVQRPRPPSAEAGAKLEEPDWFAQNAPNRPGFLMRPLVSPETLGKIMPSLGAATQAESFQAKNVNEEIAHWEKMTEVARRAGNLEAVRKYSQLAKNLQGLRDTVAGFTSPAMAGLVGGGLGLAATAAPRAVKALAGFVPSAWFAGKGAEEVTAPPKPGEAPADILERQLSGASLAAMGAAGLKGTLKPTAEAARTGARRLAAPVSPAVKAETAAWEAEAAPGAIPPSPGLARSGLRQFSIALATPAGKGGVRARAMEADLQVAQHDLSELARTNPLKTKGAERFHEQAEAIDARQDVLWKQGHEPGIRRHPNLPANTGALVAAGTQAAAAEPGVGTVGARMAARVNPAEAAAAQKWLEESVAPPMNLEELDAFVREVNADLRKPGQAQAYGPLQTRVRQAVVKAARAEIDRLLGSVGEQGVRNVNRRWGALDSIKDRLEERAAQEGIAEAGKGPWPDWLHPYAFLHPGALAIPVSIGLSARIGKIVVPDAAGRLAKGVARLGRARLVPPPLPTAPPTPAIRGLLPPATPQVPGYGYTAPVAPGGEPGGEPTPPIAPPARSIVTRDPRTGRMRRVYLGGEEVTTPPKAPEAAAPEEGAGVVPPLRPAAPKVLAGTAPLSALGRAKATDLKVGDTFLDEAGEPRRVVGKKGNIVRTADGKPRTYVGTVPLSELNTPKSGVAGGGKFRPSGAARGPVDRKILRMEKYREADKDGWMWAGEEGLFQFSNPLSRTIFHGTTLDSGLSIIKEGLKPVRGGRHMSDPFVDMEPEDRPAWYIEGKPFANFTSEIGGALEYAAPRRRETISGARPGDKYVIIEANRGGMKLNVQNLGRHDAGLATYDTLDPSQIKRVHIVESGVGDSVRVLESMSPKDFVDKYKSQRRKAAPTAPLSKLAGKPKSKKER